MTRKIRIKVSDFFKNRDEYMFPENGDKFIGMEYTRKDKRYRGAYSDVLSIDDNGRYIMAKTNGPAKTSRLYGYTEIYVVYEVKKQKPRQLVKMETFEQLVMRLAPPTSKNLAGRYS